MKNENTFFINEGFDEAFNIYENNKENIDSLEYNTFLCSVIRSLIIIYGEDIENSFINKDVAILDNVMLKYGMSVEDVEAFKLCMDRFYKFDLRQQAKAIKKKNKYFNLIQKCLIDMLIKRKAIENIDDDVLVDFSNLLFTANSKDFYRKSMAVLLAYNPYEIYEYAKKENIILGE